MNIFLKIIAEKLDLKLLMRHYQISFLKVKLFQIEYVVC